MMRKSLPAAFALVLAATLSAGPLAFAQAPQQTSHDPQAAPTPQGTSTLQAGTATPAHTPNPHRQALRIARRLSLTPDQTTKLEPILADREQKIAALRADSSLTGNAVKQQIRAIRQNTLSQLGTLLTPDQLSQLKAMQRSHAHPDAGQGQTQPPTAPPA